MPSSAIAVREELQGGRDLDPSIRAVYGDLRSRLDGDLLAICHTTGGSVCTVEEGGVLRRWNPRTGKLLETAALSDIEACWAFSNDGRRLASGGSNLSVWDVTTARLLGQQSEASWTAAVAFTPDGKKIATGHEDRRVRIWDVETGKPRQTLERHEDEVCALAFSADGSKLASAAEDRLVVLWDLESGRAEHVLTGHTDRIDALAWDRSGVRVASAGWDTSVRVWDPRTGELVGMLNGQGECVHAVAFTPDGAQLVSGDSECVVRIWDYAGLKVLAELRGHEGPVNQLAMSSDGAWLASGGADRSVHFWDLTNARPLAPEPGSFTQVETVRMAPNGDVAAGYRSGRLAVWPAGDPDRRTEVEVPTKVEALACAPDGTRWAIGFKDGRIAITANLTRAPDVIWQAHESPARHLCFQSDGSRLASSAGGDGTVKLWDPASGDAHFIIPEAVDGCSIEALAFHPTAPKLAVGGIDWLASQEREGSIAVWDLETHQRESLFRGGASRLVYSPDGALLVAVSLYHSIVLWDVATGKMMREIADDEATIRAIAIDPRNRFLAVGSDGCGLRVWETGSWKLLTTLEMDTCVNDLLFSPDGRALLTGNGNTACYRFDPENLSPAS